MRTFIVLDVFRNISLINVICPITCDPPDKGDIIELIWKERTYGARVKSAGRNLYLMYPPKASREVSIYFDFIWSCDPSNTDVSSFANP